MNLLSLENLSKSYSEKILLNNISLGINEGEKIGLIGINGTGKSTFLKIIAGIEVPDEGSIVKGNKVRIEYLSQSPHFEMEASVIEQVFKGNSEEMKILREYENTLEKLERSHNLSKDESGDLNSKLIKLHSKIDALNLWDLESEAKMVLSKLGINDFDRKVAQLSGGQRKRIALASALITPCELLILDEPTNHLDNDTINWLEQYLNKRKGALLMVTHDRYFLDRVTNRILELDKGNLYSYSGNYSIFLEKKLERQELELSNERKRQKLYEKELAWIRRGAKARTTKQKARIDRFEKLAEQKIDIAEEKIDISVMSSRLGKKIVELNNISKGYEGVEYINDFTYTFLREDRVGIIGPNGIGKTTLMKIIGGRLLPESGSVDIGETVNRGFFSQENQHMKDDMRAIEYVKEIGEFLPTSTGYRISASQMMERFLFSPEMQWTPIGKLSGGEKRRLYLLRVLMGAPNVLLLDEPTNDLDIQTLTILEDYLDDFDGTVIAVSHDRYFLDRICNKIFSYEGNGKIAVYHGNYSDYLDLVKETAVENVDKKEKAVDKKQQPVDKKYKDKKDKPLKFSFKEQKEFEEIDDIIANIEEKLKDLEESIEIHASNYEKLQELIKEKEQLELQLEEKYDRWTYLNELAEKIEKQKK